VSTILLPLVPQVPADIEVIRFRLPFPAERDGDLGANCQGRGGHECSIPTRWHPRATPPCVWQIQIVRKGYLDRDPINNRGLRITAIPVFEALEGDVGNVAGWVCTSAFAYPERVYVQNAPHTAIGGP